MFRFSLNSLFSFLQFNSSPNLSTFFFLTSSLFLHFPKYYNFFSFFELFCFVSGTFLVVVIVFLTLSLCFHFLLFSNSVILYLRFLSCTSFLVINSCTSNSPISWFFSPIYPHCVHLPRSQSKPKQIPHTFKGNNSLIFGRF